MKYLIILGDGMSDLHDNEGKTPLITANKPTIDKLAAKAEIGLVQTVPKGMKPGSDNANLSVIGYDPLLYYTGRSPLEALSMGIKLKDTDLTYRCNLVTLSPSGDYSGKTMLDYSSDEITTGESSELISYLNNKLDLHGCKLFSGVSYRHCLVVPNGKSGAIHTAPHDISDKIIADYLPKGENAEFFADLQKRSFDLLKDHPINVERMKKGLRPANSMWFWGEGKKPVLPAFIDKFGFSGAMISAVDLLKGIGYAAGMTVFEVPGATGNINTNFEGKADAALLALESHDFVYVHVEAPDECGHRGEKENKIKSIEYLDTRLIARIIDGLNKANEEFSMLILPDHATPLAKKAHTSDPVPYLLYRSNSAVKGQKTYNEDTAKASGIFEPIGHELILKLFHKK